MNRLPAEHYINYCFSHKQYRTLHNCVDEHCDPGADVPGYEPNFSIWGLSHASCAGTCGADQSGFVTIIDDFLYDRQYLLYDEFIREMLQPTERGQR